MDLPSEKNTRELTDTDLLTQVHNGDNSAFDELLSRYSSLIKSSAYRYNIYSLDIDDYLQEGFIAFLSAVKSFSFQKNASFSAYVALCVKNRFIDVNRRFLSNKHRLLNDYTEINDESIAGLYDINALNPEAILIERENVDNLMNALKNIFSPLEAQVFKERINGKAYNEIAEKYNVSVKAIDNAVQRIRKKTVKICSN